MPIQYIVILLYTYTGDLQFALAESPAVNTVYIEGHKGRERPYSRGARGNPRRLLGEGRQSRDHVIRGSVNDITEYVIPGIRDVYYLLYRPR